MKPFTIAPRYECRWVPKYLEAELSNLWHVSRVPCGNNRHQRMLWASREFSKAHPEISATAAYKDLEGMLT